MDLFNLTAVPLKERAYFRQNEEIRASAFTGLMGQDKIALVESFLYETIHSLDIYDFSI